MSTIEIDQERLAKIKVIRKGSHVSEPEEDCGDPEMCAMEARNWVRHLAWGDNGKRNDWPPDMASLTIALNDREPDDEKRTRRMREIVLMPSVPTGSLELRRRRAWAIVDWDIRWRQPRLLRVLGLTDEASRLEDLHDIVDGATAKAAQKTADEINTAVRAKRDEARAELKSRLDALDALDARAALAALAALDALDARDPKKAADIWTKVYEAARDYGYGRAREVADELLGPEVRVAQRAKWAPLVDEVNDGMLDLIKRLAAMREMP